MLLLRLLKFTVILVEDGQRNDGSENFDQPWADYEKGLGNSNGVFWYRLKALNANC